MNGAPPCDERARPCSCAGSGRGCGRAGRRRTRAGRPRPAARNAQAAHCEPSAPTTSAAERGGRRVRPRARRRRRRRRHGCVPRSACSSVAVALGVHHAVRLLGGRGRRGLRGRQRGLRRLRTGERRLAPRSTAAAEIFGYLVPRLSLVRPLAALTAVTQTFRSGFGRDLLRLRRRGRARRRTAWCRWSARCRAGQAGDDLLRRGVARRVLLHRDGHELTAGRGGRGAAGLGRDRDDPVAEAGLLRVGQLPGAVLAEARSRRSRTPASWWSACSGCTEFGA